MIYFIVEEGSRFVKIGYCAGRPEARMRVLQIGNPHTLVLAACCDGSICNEYILHERFADCRSGGEWFVLTDELSAFIEDVKANPRCVKPEYARLTDLERRELRAIIKTKCGAVSELAREIGVSAKTVGSFLQGNGNSDRIGLAVRHKARQILTAALLAACLAVPAAAQTTFDDRFYRTSAYVAIGAQGADIASSWGGIEANPVLGRGQRYGWQATGIKLGVVATGLLIQRYVLRRHPQHKRVAAIVNFALAGATAGVAVHNVRVRTK